MPNHPPPSPPNRRPDTGGPSHTDWSRRMPSISIAMWWIVVGAVMVAAGATWAFGPIGLIVAGVLVIVAGLWLSPSDEVAS